MIPAARIGFMFRAWRGVWYSDSHERARAQKKWELTNQERDSLIFTEPHGLLKFLFPNLLAVYLPPISYLGKEKGAPQDAPSLH